MEVGDQEDELDVNLAWEEVHQDLLKVVRRGW
jgi:hypothetical protein